MKKRRLLSGLTAAVLAAGLLTGCGTQPTGENALSGSGGASLAQTASQNGSTADWETVVFTDSLGREVRLEAEPRAVAVMVGSYADVWQLAGGTVAATTQDAWDQNIGLPQETVNAGSHQEPDLEALLAAEPDFVILTPDIEGQLGLQETLEAIGLPQETVNAGSHQEPDLEALLAAEPDFVILTPDIEGQLGLQETLEAARIPAAYFHVDSFEEYLHMLEICTRITGRDDLYQENGAALQEQIERMIDSVQGKQAPRVLLMRAYSSGVKAKNSDNFVGAMLNDLGAVNIADSDASLLEDLQMESIVAADPDVILITTMGNEQKALDNLSATLQADPAWSALRAVENGDVNVLQKDLFHYKPNARWAESYETLATILYDE